VNPVERVIRGADRAQQRFPPLAFVFGVIKKYGDDKGGVLASNLAYSGFVSLFPLLLVLTTVLGLIAADNAGFRNEVTNAVAGQFPLIGKHLTGNVGQLRQSSVIGLIVGLAGLLWGSSGLAQAGLFTMEQVWNLPGPARPGFVQRLGRAGVFIGVLAAGVLASTLLASLNTYGQKAAVFAVLAQVGAMAVNVGMYLAAFRVLTPKGVPTRSLVPGVVVGGVLWTLLLILGTYLVHHFLHSDSVYGVFATVLGLLAWIYLGVQVTIYAAEINVVLARRLWPRSIVQPPLTEADRASLALQVLQNQSREEQLVHVSYDDRRPGESPPSTTPRTPEQVAPPAEPLGDRPAAGGTPTGSPKPSDNR
jgi:YihY family inner membrane protein